MASQPNTLALRHDHLGRLRKCEHVEWSAPCGACSRVAVNLGDYLMQAAESLLVVLASWIAIWTGSTRALMHSPKMRIMWINSGAILIAS